jgi:type II secretory pathway predicted ATPase ExeA
MIGLFKRSGFLYRSAFPPPLAVSPKNALGLDEAPLTAGENNRFLYEFPLLARQVTLIKALSSSRNLVTLVLGERGSGKTTLLNYFMRESGLPWECYRLLSPIDEAHDTAKAVEPPSLANWGRPLFISKEGDTSRLLMDDAHQLSHCEMKLVLASAWSETRKRKLGGIILFSEPRLRASLSELSRFLPPATVINRLYVPALSRQGTEAYLSYRIRTAGYLKRLPFSERQLDEIHTISRGRPGWINGEAFMMYRRLLATQRHASHIEDIGMEMDTNGLPAT